jgi:hypothetical protein
MLTNTSERIEKIRNIDELREFVRETLCAKENLVSEQFPMNEIVLRRGEQSCGLQFLLFGPRSIRLGAIWAADHNVIYFYAANGERYLKVPLKHRLVDTAVPAVTSS